MTEQKVELALADECEGIALALESDAWRYEQWQPAAPAMLPACDST